MMNQAGFMPGDSVRKSLSLFAEEVYPAIRDLGESSAQTAPTTPLPTGAGAATN